MKYFLITLAVLALLGGGVYLLVTQINWTKLLHLEQISDSAEAKFGNFLWRNVEATSTACKNSEIVEVVDSMLTKICVANNLPRTDFKLHVLQSTTVNAFAMPAGHLAVYTGLLDSCAHQDEVAGILCHEIAHVKKRHVMKKLIGQLGLSAVLAMIAGDAGGQLIMQVVQGLSAKAYDRSLETEADEQGVAYMQQAKINPEGLAKFLNSLAQQEGENKLMEWMSTHPASAERVKQVRALAAKTRMSYTPIVADETWQRLKQNL